MTCLQVQAHVCRSRVVSHGANMRLNIDQMSWRVRQCDVVLGEVVERVDGMITVVSRDSSVTMRCAGLMPSRAMYGPDDCKQQ